MLTSTPPPHPHPRLLGARKVVGVQSPLAQLLLFPQRKILDLNQRNGRMNLAGARKAGDGMVQESGFSGQERARKQSSQCVLRLKGSVKPADEGASWRKAQVTSPCNPHSVDCPGGGTVDPTRASSRPTPCGLL